MNSLYNYWRSFQNNLLQYLSALLLVGLTLLALVEVIRRYILGVSFEWQQDLVTFGILSGIFLLALPILVVRLSGNWIELSIKLSESASLAAGGLLLLHIIGANHPPSTGSAVPVIHSASSEAQNTATRPMSLGKPRRGSGVRCREVSICSSVR